MMVINFRNLLAVMILIVASVIHTRFAEASASWPNEPSGSKVLLDCAFSNTICNFSNVYNTLAFATDNGAPHSPPTVFDTYLDAGSSNGNGKWYYPMPNVREVYVGTWWKTNPQFQGLSNSSNKLFVQKGDRGNGYLLWYGGQDQPKQIRMTINSAGVWNNCHVSNPGPDCANAPYFNPNVSGGTITAGSGWHRLEVYQKASTTATSRDGILRWWVDGVLVGNYTNVNYMHNGFGNGGEFTITHTWDGAFSCADRDCSRSWHHYWDSMHLSVGGGGGSASDQPPGPPAEPRILNVTAQ